MNKDEDFDIIVSSYACRDIFDTNHAGSFRNLLSKRLEFHGDWSVALTQICILATWSRELNITIKFMATNLKAYMLQPVSTREMLRPWLNI